MQPTTSGKLLFLVTPSFAHTFPHQWPGHPRNSPLLCCCGYYVTMALGSRALQHDVAVGAGRQGRCEPRPLGVPSQLVQWLQVTGNLPLSTHSRGRVNCCAQGPSLLSAAGLLAQAQRAAGAIAQTAAYVCAVCAEAP